MDSANRHGILLEMVQVLTDLDLVISKSYICSDGGWLMDGECLNAPPHRQSPIKYQTVIFSAPNSFVFSLFGVAWLAVFHVRDQLGKKITDETLNLYIQQVSSLYFF